MAVDNDEIPAPAEEPSLVNAVFPIADVVVFDLETTGFGRDCQIVQLAALRLSSPGITFSRYVLPSITISHEATKVTKLSLGRASGKDILLHNNKQVDAVSWEVVEEDFVAWLDQTGASNCVLLAHNCYTFDARVLLSQCSTSLKTKVLAFVDSLPALRARLPSYKSHTVSALQAEFAKDIPLDAHDAVSDVLALATILKSAPVGIEELQKVSATLESFCQRSEFRAHANDRLVSFNQVVQAKALSKSMAQKASSSGLLFRHIRLAHRRNGSDGVSQLLSETVGSVKPRVTKSKKIIEALVEYCSNLDQ